MSIAITTPDFHGSALRHGLACPKLQSFGLKKPLDVPGNFFFHTFPYLLSIQAFELETSRNYSRLLLLKQITVMS